MARGFSVHVGVDKADPAFKTTELKGCVKDAEAMERIAQSCHFERRQIFRDEKAKFADVRDEILFAAKELKDGDIFLFTFSGHGSTHPTFNIGEEPDRQDETILLYDCILIDNYLRRNLWSKFLPGVRILGVADSCHSGSVLFTFMGQPLPESIGSFIAPISEAVTAGFKSLTSFEKAPIRADNAAEPVYREFTEEDRKEILKASPQIHKDLRKELLPHKPLKATLMTLAACSDQEKARDGEGNGVFTDALLLALREPPVPENYDELMSRISQKLEFQNIPQHPVRYPKVNPDPNFVGQVPFSI